MNNAKRRLFSYVVRRDFGFAPNPFYGFCTLAACKPQIRKTAQIGDWIIGTGSVTKELNGRLVFVMRVAEAITFDEYWHDERFGRKKPRLRSSLKRAYGDNIYHREQGGWFQENSHHSLVGGEPNAENVRRDTQTDRVLISEEFSFWGGAGPKIPAKYRNWGGIDICHQHPGHKCKFPDDLVESFIEWYRSFEEIAYISEPTEFEL